MDATAVLLLLLLLLPAGVTLLADFAGFPPWFFKQAPKFLFLLVGLGFSSLSFGLEVGREYWRDCCLGDPDLLRPGWYHPLTPPVHRSPRH